MVPDRRGLITGIAVGGFGAGALITAPVASRLIQVVGVLPTFAYLGVAYFIVAIIAALFIRNPPEGWQPEGWTPTEKQVSQRASHDFVLPEAPKTWQWWVLWLILFLNTCAGIAVISQEAPIFQELTGVTAVVAGGMVGVASLGNGVGHVFWAWLAVHRAHARDHGKLCGRTPRHRHRNARFHSAANYRQAAARSTIGVNITTRLFLLA